MSIAAGIVTSITALTTLVWCTVGDRIAAIPAVARIVAYVDGGFNLPTEEQVNELMEASRDRRDRGIDHDQLVPGKFSQTFGESIASAHMPACIREEAIDDVVERAQFTWARGWMSGSMNMPTEAEIGAASPHTLRGRYAHIVIPAGFTFGDEPASAAHLPNPTGLVYEPKRYEVVG